MSKTKISHRNYTNAHKGEGDHGIHAKPSCIKRQPVYDSLRYNCLWEKNLLPKEGKLAFKLNHSINNHFFKNA